MRVTKTTATTPPKSTYTRKAVKKAIECQDQERLSSPDVQEAIRIKAYQLFLARGSEWGNPEQDWIDAEKIVLKKMLSK